MSKRRSWQRKAGMEVARSGSLVQKGFAASSISGSGFDGWRL